MAETTTVPDLTVDGLGCFVVPPGDDHVVLNIHSKNIDSCGAMQLMRFFQATKHRGLTVRVANKRVMVVLQMLGLDRIIRIEPLV